MAHNSRIRANLAAWATGTSVSDAEFDALDQAQFESVNGDDGGTWAPAAQVILGGAGLRVDGPGGWYASSGFNANMMAMNWPARFAITDGATVNSDLCIAWDLTLGVSGGPRYCILTKAGRSFTSEDGQVWKDRGTYNGIFTSTACDIAVGTYSGSRAFMASADSSGKLIKTVDGGVNWAAAAGGGSVVGTAAILQYAFLLNLWAAAGDAGTMHTSPDGVTWTSRTTPANWIANSGGAKRLVYNGSIFVCLPKASYDKFLTSPDGITWTERTVTTAAWSGLAYTTFPTPMWMAVSGTTVWKSTDGINWTDCVPNIGNQYDLAVNGPVWVSSGAGGAGGGILWSADMGHSWTKVAVGDQSVATAGYKRVFCADAHFIAIHSDGTNLEGAVSLRSS